MNKLGVIIFLSYGNGPHVAEAIFSIHSIIYHCNGLPRHFQIAVFTDTPEAFADLAVDIVSLTARQLQDWSGPSNYGHRQKICVLGEALERYRQPCILIDVDTYFLRNPRPLFDRVQPGKSVMHICEGRIGYLKVLGNLRTSLPGLSITLRDETVYRFTKESEMWNTGVVGVHPNDRDLIREMLELSDAILAATGHILSEQLAIAEVLRKRTSRSSASDIVFHYHQPMLREPFRATLATVLTEMHTETDVQRAKNLYLHRPIAPMSKRVKAMLKRAAKPFNLFRHDMESSI